MARAFLRSSILACALVATLGLHSTPASADPAQLCRAFSTMLLAPTDLVLGPYVVGEDLYWGLVDQEDPTWMKVAYGPPGYAFLLGLQAGATILRIAAGTLEIVPGLFTFFQDTSPDPLFTSQDESLAVYSEDFGPCPVRIGVHYNTINQ